MAKAKKKQDQVLLTTEEVCSMFGLRTAMTLYNWRKRHGFPEIQLPKGEQRHFVRFPLNDVIEWARAKGKPIVNEYRNH